MLNLTFCMKMDEATFDTKEELLTALHEMGATDLTIEDMEDGLIIYDGNGAILMVDETTEGQ